MGKQDFDKLGADPLQKQSLLFRLILLVFLITSPFSNAKAKSPEEICPQHMGFNGFQLRCYPHIDLSQTIERMRTFSCQIFSDNDHARYRVKDLTLLEAPPPSTEFSIPENCDKECLQRLELTVSANLNFLTNSYRMQKDAYERNEFGVDVADSAASLYRTLKSRLENVYEISLRRHQMNPKMHPKVCEPEEFKKDLALIESARKEAQAIVDSTEPIVSVREAAADRTEEIRNELRENLMDSFQELCVPRMHYKEPLPPPYNAEHLQPLPEHQQKFCENIFAILEKNSEGSSIGGAWNIASALMGGDTTEILQTFDKELTEHPWIRYFLIDHGGMTKDIARSLIGLIDNIDGLHPTERNFLMALFGKDISNAEVELLVSKEATEFISKAMETPDLLERIRLYSTWTKENPRMAAALEKWIRDNYDAFREMVAYSVESSDSLAPKQKELLTAIIRDPVLAHPDVPLDYTDLVIELAGTNFTRDPLGVIKKITDFTYNPDRQSAVDTGKQLINAHFPLIQEVTLEALNSFYIAEPDFPITPDEQVQNRHLELNGKQLTKSQFELVKLMIESARPEDFNYIIDFALKLSTSDDTASKLDAWIALLADADAVGVTKEFISKNFPTLKQAMLDTLNQFKGELLDPNDPILTISQFEVLYSMLAEAEEGGVSLALDYAHQFVRAKTGSEKVDLLFKLAAEEKALDSIVSFSTNPTNHNNLITAITEGLIKYESDLVRSKEKPSAPMTKNQLNAVLLLLEKSSPEALGEIGTLGQALLKDQNWQNRITLLTEFLRNAENIEGLKLIAENDEELKVYAAAITDVILENRDNLVTGELESPLTENQYALILELLKEPKAEILHRSLDHVHAIVRAQKPKERMQAIEALAADPLIFASLQNFAQGEEKIEYLRNSMIEAFDANRSLLMSDDIGLSANQLDAIRLLLNEVDSRNLNDAFTHAHNFAKAESTQARFGYLRSLFLDADKFGGIQRFLTDPAKFRIVQAAILDSLNDFEDKLISGKEPPLTTKQLALLRTLLQDLEPNSLLMGIEFAQAWLKAESGARKYQLLADFIRDRERFPIIAEFVDKHFALVRATALELIDLKEAALLEAGMTRADINLARSLLQESSRDEYRDAILFVETFMRTPEDRDAYLIALREFLAKHPQAKTRFTRLLTGPALPAIKDVLQEVINGSDLPEAGKDHLNRLVRGSTPEGLTTILVHSDPLLTIMTDPNLRVPLHERNEADEWIMRVTEMSRRYPRELRSVVEANRQMISDVTVATDRYLKSPSTDDMDPNLRKVIVSFLNGFRGQRPIKSDPDPKRWHPFFQLGFQRDRAYELIYEELARQRGVSAARVRSDIEWEQQQDRGNRSVYIQWRGKTEDIDILAGKLQYPLIEEHAVHYAEWGAQELGYAIFKGEKLDALDVEVVHQYMDHLVTYMEQKDSTKPYIPQIENLKAFINRYYEAGLSPRALAQRREDQKPILEKIFGSPGRDAK